MTTIPLIQNTENGKHFYELHVKDQKAFIEYSSFSNNVMLLMSSGFTKNLLNADEVSEALIERVLDRFRKMNYKIISYCPRINTVSYTHLTLPTIYSV